jgi:hypothetical protein
MRGRHSFKLGVDVAKARACGVLDNRIDGPLPTRNFWGERLTDADRFASVQATEPSDPKRRTGPRGEHPQISPLARIPSSHPQFVHKSW